jgi:hypothetical protein
MADTLLSQTGISQARASSPTAPVAIPLGQILPWAILGGLLMLLAVYFIGAEQGATSLFKGMYVHEFVHDGRHLLGFPCH